jgi:hypothetical protein
MKKLPSNPQLPQRSVLTMKLLARNYRQPGRQAGRQAGRQEGRQAGRAKAK